MKVFNIGISEITPYLKNPRKNEKAVNQVALSISEFGFQQPIVVDKNNVIIVGHTRFYASKELNLELIPVVFASHLTDEQCRAYRIADNKTNEFAEWDLELLAEELSNLDGCFTGFTDDEIAEICGTVNEGLTDDDTVPEIPEIPIAKLGDIYQLGNHRLMCGDSRESEMVEKLMASDKADICFTDPPYNVAYEGKTKDALTIQNDSMTDEKFYEMLILTFNNTYQQLQDGAPIYITCPLEDGIFQKAFMEVGFKLQSVLIWLKNTMVMGRKDYHYKHEPILYGWKKGSAHFWQGGRDKVSVIKCDKPPRNGEHPTMKPVELIEILLGNSGRHDAIVIDLFGGSGSTLIACEKTNRNARLMEIDPRYVDVVIKRWEDFTGKAAIKIGSYND